MNPDQGPQIFQPGQTPSSYPGQYSPYPTVPEQLPPGPPPKKSRKLLFGVLGLVAILVIGGLLAMLLSKNPEQSTGRTHDITKPYDSPAGLLAPFQTGSVSGGSFKLSAAYITGDNFTREGKFFVEDGRMYFEMLPDEMAVNELIRSLYTKQGQGGAYTVQSQGATRNFTYDFNSFMGYNFLYDVNAAPYGGPIAAVEAAKQDAKAAEGKPFKLTAACDTALETVKAKTGPNLTTTSVVYDHSLHEGRPRVTLDLASRKALDAAVVDFLESCFDLNQPAMLGYQRRAKQLKEQTTPSPTFTYWQEGDKYMLSIQVPDAAAATPPEIKLELTELDQIATPRSGHDASYIEKRNQFGLTYSLCRVSPVVAGNGKYRFTLEDEGYLPPRDADEAYYCRTLDVPPQYQSPDSMQLKTTDGATLSVAAADVNNHRAMHDLLFQVEKYQLDRKRYPGPTEFADLAANNMGELAGAAQTLLRDKAFLYEPRPAECIGTCQDFIFSYVVSPAMTLRRQAYKP